MEMEAQGTDLRTRQEEGKDELKEQHWNIRIPTRGTAGGNLLPSTGSSTQNSVTAEGVGGRREAEGGGDVSTPTAGSRSRVAETNTTP